MTTPHHTDKHLVMRGSSVDIIERCAAFLRISGDFEGILDYAEEEDEEGNLLHEGKFQDLLRQLDKEAMRIIAKESQ
jgi:hypothetical protein